MKKAISKLLPFLGMLLLATGSVVVSCATTSVMDDKSISLNTGDAGNGKIYTIYVLSDIQSVIIADLSDRSRKIELSKDEWEYNPDTTELSILRKIPFTDFFANVEGRYTVPSTFVLNNIKSYEELLVIIDNRLAIEGYDYSFNTQTDRLVFRNDIDLKNTGWYISYSTPEGGTGFGEWKPENQDQMSYLEAEHRKRYLDSWYAGQDSFWFLDNSGSPAQPPTLVKREASTEELEAMKSYPVSVFKMRFDSKFTELSKEMGFNISLPEKVNTEDPSEIFSIFSKSIEEYTYGGELIRKLHVTYETTEWYKDNHSVFDIVISPVNTKEPEQVKTEQLIDETSLDLGLPVQRTREWALLTQDIEQKPEVVSLTSWTWSNGTAKFHISGESSDEKIYQELIRKIIE